MLGSKSKLFKTNSIAIGTEELFQRKMYIKKHFFTKWHLEKFTNRMNRGYKITLGSLRSVPPPPAFFYSKNRPTLMLLLEPSAY